MSSELTVASLAFAAGASLLAGLIFGTVPAFRLSMPDANHALRDGSRGTASSGVRRNHNALVLIECARRWCCLRAPACWSGA